MTYGTAPCETGRNTAERPLTSGSYFGFLLRGKLQLLPHFDQIGIFQDALVEIENLHVTLRIAEVGLRQL